MPAGRSPLALLFAACLLSSAIAAAQRAPSTETDALLRSPTLSPEGHKAIQDRIEAVHARFREKHGGLGPDSHAQPVRRHRGGGEMTGSRLYLIGDIPGFTPQIARLVSMMNYARHTTLADVDGLEVHQLDYLHDRQSNSIGALLLHIAAVEVFYQAATFRGRGFDAEERREWSAAMDLGERGRREIRGNKLDYYLAKLRQVRAQTLAELGRREDRWLAEQTPFWGGQPANNYFKWFHVFEDELNHRGQIRWLRRRATGQAD